MLILLLLLLLLLRLTMLTVGRAAACESAHEAIDTKLWTDVQVMSDGNCNWTPLGIFISSCAIDIRWFPFDDQRCYMKFGSWTYDGTKLNLIASTKSTIEEAIYQPSSEWDLLGLSLGAGHFGHKTLRHHKIGAEV